MDDLVKLTQMHYKKLRRESEGNREVRELPAIRKGQLQQHPEFIEKKKKQRRQRSMKLRQSRNSLARSEIKPSLPGSLLSPPDSPQNQTVDFGPIGSPISGFLKSEMSQAHMTDLLQRNSPHQRSNVTFVPAIS